MVAMVRPRSHENGPTPEPRNGKLRSTSQSLYAMFGIGAGGLTSNIITGWLMDQSGVEMPYVVGGVGALLLGLSLKLVLPKV